MKTRKLKARIYKLGKELRKMKDRLTAELQPLSERTERLQQQMDRLERLYKTPVDYHELLALSKKENLYPLQG